MESVVLVETVGQLRPMVRVELDNALAPTAQKYEFAAGVGIVPEALPMTFWLRVRLNSFVPWLRSVLADGLVSA